MVLSDKITITSDIYFQHGTDFLKAVKYGRHEAISFCMKDLTGNRFLQHFYENARKLKGEYTNPVNFCMRGNVLCKGTQVHSYYLLVGAQFLPSFLGYWGIRLQRL